MENRMLRQLVCCSIVLASLVLSSYGHLRYGKEVRPQAIHDNDKVARSQSYFQRYLARQIMSQIRELTLRRQENQFTKGGWAMNYNEGMMVIQYFIIRIHSFYHKHSFIHYFTYYMFIQIKIVKLRNEYKRHKIIAL